MTRRRHRVMAFAAILILWAGSAHAQPCRADYIAVVQQFYAKLFAEKPPSTDKCARIFGEAFFKTEEQTFREICRQNRLDSTKCLEELMDYYSHIDTASVYFLKVREQRTELTQDLAKEEMRQLVNIHSRLLNFGDLGMVLRINFRNQRYLHFVMKVQPNDTVAITGVYLTDGSSVANRIFEGRNEYLMLPGTIKDPEGYVYVRNSPSDNALIEGKITEGDVFMYIPDSEARWWKVKMDGRSQVEGYVRSGCIYMRPQN